MDMLFGWADVVYGSTDISPGDLGNRSLLLVKISVICVKPLDTKKRPRTLLDRFALCRKLFITDSELPILDQDELNLDSSRYWYWPQKFVCTSWRHHSSVWQLN